MGATCYKGLFARVFCVLKCVHRCVQKCVQCVQGVSVRSSAAKAMEDRGAEIAEGAKEGGFRPRDDRTTDYGTKDAMCQGL